ncbi:LemA family protein [uncultured Subdoligranulum sp.]|uniref:LemA family protein n=1 Tax=uncultured Subdoligranulum sp. TaxID=512298 RepID=UPI0025EB3498|nr:LemA family protein [uncultured Subdoligranulum sp.]
MQLEQQETFVIHGPQLEVFGELETKLPAPAKKRPVAALALAALALVSVFGIGGARLKGLRSSTARIYTTQQDEYGHSIQGDLAAQTDAAASLIRVAGNVLGQEDADVQNAQAALDAWNAEASADAPAVQYKLNTQLTGAVDILYTAAADEADSKAKGQLDDLYDSFTSAQATIERAAADYNAKAEAYNEKVTAFPANVLAGLWDAGALQTFAPSDFATG